MSLKKNIVEIGRELRRHAPFTAAGAVLGVVFMVVFRNLSEAGSHRLFVIFHPGHVILSALVTASMFKLHARRKRLLLVLVVGYLGAIGVATLSDIVIPHIGSQLLGLDIPTHAEVHLHENEHENHSEQMHEENDGEHNGSRLHFGFIEDWYIVNPAAILGALFAFFIPTTRFPHAGHVLISTWASSSYLLMNMQAELSVAVWVGIFVTLFIATWLPCCISDIVFPLLLVRKT